jgi:hypothetical protein
VRVLDEKLARYLAQLLDENLASAGTSALELVKSGGPAHAKGRRAKAIQASRRTSR